MKFRILKSIVLVLPLLFHKPLLGENTKQLVKRTSVVKGEISNRKVASINDRSQTTLRIRNRNFYLNPDRATHLRFFLYGGFSSLESSDSLIQEFRNEQKIGSNILAGLGADLRFERYFGAEIDTYYGIAQTQTIIFDEEETQKKKIHHLGGMFNVKGQYPILFEGIRIVPKLGVGYGFMNLKQTTESQLLSETYEASETVKGIYGTLGFDLEPIPWLLFTADYSRSFSGSGTYSLKSNTLNAEENLIDSQFERLRLGLLFRVHPNVMVGGNYIRRTMSYTTAGGGANMGISSASSLLDISNSETLSQVAATLLFQF